MDGSSAPSKTCPDCGSDDYQFRVRKKITPEPGQEGPEEMETKYRCKKCGKEWKVKVPVQGQTER